MIGDDIIDFIEWCICVECVSTFAAEEISAVAWFRGCPQPPGYATTSHRILRSPTWDWPALAIIMVAKVRERCHRAY